MFRTFCKVFNKRKIKINLTELGRFILRLKLTLSRFNINLNIAPFALIKPQNTQNTARKMSG